MLNGFPVLINSLITRMGRNVTVRRYVNTGPAYNPSQTYTDTTVKAVIFDYVTSEFRDSIIQRGDKEAVFSNISLNKNDKIIDGSREYTVVAVDEVAPGNDTLMFTAQLRS